MNHEIWMRKALELAEKGRYRVSPNPKVGACVVRGGKLVGEGYHRFFGGAHAEIEALRQAGIRARGATLYVTLEPCSSWGKTPPCTQAIQKAGIAHVVMAMIDPNPLNQGKGVRFLKSQGIRVTQGILAREAAALNDSFCYWIKTGVPRVTLKMAQSLDGKIATVSGQSRWISSEPARRYVQELRATHDAILVGGNTALQDDPSLRVKGIPGASRLRPWRVVLDAKLKVPASAKVFKGNPPALRVVSEKEIRNVRKTLASGAMLIPVPEIRGRLDLNAALKTLGGLGISSLLVEGGGETAWSFLRAGVVHRVVWIVAPKFLGGRLAKTSLEGEGIADLSGAWSLKKMKISRLGPDLVIEGYL